MGRRPVADGGTTVDPTDREALQRHLERFAGAGEVTEADDGALSAEFGQSTYVTIGPDGRVDSGMPLHAFDAPADTLVFDHDAGELRVEFGDGEAAVSYTFRRP
ncbi:hypothetical protein [Haloarcula nitratireducens]|uniref:Halobacterial output domain-containing protein n=1 Tax=Haloarcula nitratireducens TaxID=2487749 RepID=A0AAW4P9F8_9EURY|nr:hypothetical protein [Halomicroarcula nitratireducens]MBX0294499.1 hypothetical protein [Halomicroarcula nitratireducens]